jgi:hypothetical protein
VPEFAFTDLLPLGADETPYTGRAIVMGKRGRHVLTDGRRP